MGASSHAFADVAATRIFLVVTTLRDPTLSVSKVFSLAHAGFAYRPTALFVLPFTLSFAIVLVTAFALVRHIATPSRLAPFRVLALPADDNPHRRRRTLLAGRTLWSWGALVFACLTVGQLFVQLKYGRLASGLLAPRILEDIAFFVLWSTAFAHIISAHHTVPLLRSTPTYEPRPVLARPLLRPFSTTAAIVAFPLLLVATLASAIYYDSDGIVALHSSIQRTSQLFDHASDEKPTTTPTRTILGPDSYALMQQEMADGWKSALRGTASAVKASALVVLVLTLCAVETRAYLRYWQLSKNARRESRLARYGGSARRRRFVDDVDDDDRKSFRPSSRQSDNRQHAFVPTLPFEQPRPASLPMCRTATHSSSNASSSSCSSIGSVDSAAYLCDLRSATPYTTLPRSTTSRSLWERSRSRNDQAGAGDDDNLTMTPSSTSTRLPYSDPSRRRPMRSGSFDSTLEYVPSLSRHDDGGISLPPSFPATPISSSSSSSLDRARDTQDREFERYRLARPREAAQRRGRQTSWDPPPPPPIPTRDALALLVREDERRTSRDTLPPVYASRAGSRKTKRGWGHDVETEDEWDDDVNDDYGFRMAWTRTLEGDEAGEKKEGEGRSDDVSSDLRHGDESDHEYTGPSSRCFKAMMRARLADALWSSATIVALAVLFVVKAVWAHEITSSRGFSLFVLVVENTVPSVVLGVYFSVTFCRRASAQIDADLFKRTRWGRDLDEAGWWIPRDEAEAKATMGFRR